MKVQQVSVSQSTDTEPAALTEGPTGLGQSIVSQSTDTEPAALTEGPTGLGQSVYEC